MTINQKEIDRKVAAVTRTLEYDIQSLKRIEAWIPGLIDTINQLLGRLRDEDKLLIANTYTSGDRLVLNADEDVDPNARELVKAISRIFGLGTKSKSYDGKLIVTFTSVFNSKIEVRGYVPKTCRLVEKTREVPAVEAQPARSETYFEVECDTEASDE